MQFVNPWVLGIVGVAAAHQAFNFFRFKCIYQELSLTYESTKVFLNRIDKPLDWAKNVMSSGRLRADDLTADDLRDLALYYRFKSITQADVAEGLRLAGVAGKVITSANQAHLSPEGNIQTQELLRMSVDLERGCGALGAWLQAHESYLSLRQVFDDAATYEADAKLVSNPTPTNLTTLRHSILKRYPDSPYRLVTYARTVQNAVRQLETLTGRVSADLESFPARADIYSPFLLDVKKFRGQLVCLHTSVLLFDEYDKHLTLLNQEQDRVRLLEMQREKLEESRRSNRVKEDALYNLQRDSARTVVNISDLRRDVRNLAEIVDRGFTRLEDAICKGADRQSQAIQRFSNSSPAPSAPPIPEFAGTKTV